MLLLNAEHSCRKPNILVERRTFLTNAECSCRLSKIRVSHAEHGIPSHRYSAEFADRRIFVFVRKAQNDPPETVPQKSCNPEALVSLNDSDFPTTITNPEIKRMIIAAGPTQPEGPFPKDPPKPVVHFLILTAAL